MNREFGKWSMHAIPHALVMSTTGGMGKSANTFYKSLAGMMTEKRSTEYM